MSTQEDIIRRFNNKVAFKLKPSNDTMEAVRLYAKELPYFIEEVESEVIAMLRYSKHNPPVDCECDTCLKVIPEIEEIFKKLKGKDNANNL